LIRYINASGQSYTASEIREMMAATGLTDIVCLDYTLTTIRYKL
jgi:hypothetical protein